MFCSESIQFVRKMFSYEKPKKALPEGDFYEEAVCQWGGKLGIITTKPKLSGNFEINQWHTPRLRCVYEDRI
jgi:hypothetical protein